MTPNRPIDAEQLAREAENWLNLAFPTLPMSKVRRTRRAKRRHNHRLAKAHARRIWKNIWGREYNPQAIAKMAHTMKPCSGRCCGNPRHHWKGATTRQEKLSALEINEVMNDPQNASFNLRS